MSIRLKGIILNLIAVIFVLGLMIFKPIIVDDSGFYVINMVNQDFMVYKTPSFSFGCDTAIDVVYEDEEKIYEFPCSTMKDTYRVKKGNKVMTLSEVLEKEEVPANDLVEAIDELHVSKKDGE